MSLKWARQEPQCHIKLFIILDDVITLLAYTGRYKWGPLWMAQSSTRCTARCVGTLHGKNVGGVSNRCRIAFNDCVFSDNDFCVQSAAIRSPDGHMIGLFEPADQGGQP